MTINELIEQLDQYAPDVEVDVYDSDEGEVPLTKVGLSHGRVVLS